MDRCAIPHVRLQPALCGFACPLLSVPQLTETPSIRLQTTGRAYCAVLTGPPSKRRAGRRYRQARQWEVPEHPVPLSAALGRLNWCVKESSPCRFSLVAAAFTNRRATNRHQRRDHPQVLTPSPQLAGKTSASSRDIPNKVSNFRSPGRRFRLRRVHRFPISSAHSTVNLEAEESFNASLYRPTDGMRPAEWMRRGCFRIPAARS